MGLRNWFRRLAGAKAPTHQERWWETDFPDWARPIGNQARFTAFMDAVHRYFAMRGTPVFLHYEGSVHHLDGAEGSLGLGNLLQICATHETDQFRGVVAGHFDMIERIDSQTHASKTQNWDQVKDRLRLRLWEDDDNPIIPISALRRDIPHLATVLSTDWPEAIQTVPKDIAAGWGRSEHELFSLAMQQTWDSVKPKSVALEMGDIEGMYLVEADSYYTASVVLEIEKLPELIGEYGVFVSVPTRHAVLAVPFHNAEDIGKLVHLMGFTRHLFEAGPGSISHRVWWRHDGTWREIDYESDPQRLQVMPPKELIELLERIGPAGT